MKIKTITSIAFPSGFLKRGIDNDTYLQTFIIKENLPAVKKRLDQKKK